MKRLLRWLLTPWRLYRRRRAWKKVAKGMMAGITAEPRDWFTLND